MRTEFCNLGVGLGLRRSFIHEVAQTLPFDVDWFEIAPENYMERGGEVYASFEQVADHYPLVAHGLSLSIGSLDSLNWTYLKKLKQFLRDFHIPWMSDHLCFSSYQNHYYHDLLPLPHTWEAVHHVSERARIVQDYLEVPFALENVSTYFSPAPPEMKEQEFVTEVIQRAGISLMLDVNNVYVNATNHRFNAKEYLDYVVDQVPIIQMHMAGHFVESSDLIIDTHGSSIATEVWHLLHYLAQQGELPSILIERDHHIPPLQELLKEVAFAQTIWLQSQKHHQQQRQSISIEETSWL